MEERFSVSNKFLSKVMQQLRLSRRMTTSPAIFYNRLEKSKAGNYVEVWFKTDGCQWDSKNGGCTICNYGHSNNTSEEEMIHAVKNGLSAIEVNVDELVVSPSGSMLDPIEVPASTRRSIFSLVNDFPTPYFIFETRADTIKDDVIKEFSQLVKNKKLGVEVGLESSNPWIQRFCINKGSHPNFFYRASNVLKTYGIESIANISLGVPFLSAIEAIDDCVKSILWSFSNGANLAVVFPLHVKPNTLLEWLYKENLYKPPSLWSLVEVLSRVGPVLAEKTDISWYRSYYDDATKIIASPDTCPVCIDKVYKLLDNYRATRNYSTIKELIEFNCQCKEDWRKEVDKYPEVELTKRVWTFYKHIGEKILGKEISKNYLNFVFSEEMRTTFI